MVSQFKLEMVDESYALKHKTCSICKKSKHLNEFFRITRKNGHQDSECKKCKNEKAELWRKNNHSIYRNRTNVYRQKNTEKRSSEFKRNRKTYRSSHLKRNFGLSIERYDELLISQNFCCAICNKHQSECEKSLSVDHCHETGAIRGLLCIKCNTGLGALGDNLNSLMKAIKYLKGHS